MTSEDVRTLLESGPNPRVEYLPETAPPKRLLETMAAFANAAGGTIIVGVGREGVPCGLARPDEARRRAIELALQIVPPLVMPLPETVQAGEKTLLIVVVPAGLPHVYSVDGRYLLRVGRQNQPLTGDALQQAVLARSDSHFEATPAAGADRDDLSSDHLQLYADRLQASRVDLDELLVSRGCLARVGGQLQPTMAGILLFGSDPQRFLPSAEILAVRYPGATMSDEFIKEQIRGTLPEQIRRAVGFVERMELQRTRLSGLQREENSLYPPAAVREVIVNAVAHREYRQRGDSIRLLLFSDRIECYSPGRLPGHVTIQNIVQERYSRNEVLVQVLSDLGFIERLGYGIDRILRLSEDWHLPAPHFEETAAGFRVTLHGPAGAPRSYSLPHDQGHWVHLDLNPRQEHAIRFLEEHGRITNRDLKQLYSEVSEETIRRDFADLVSKNLLLKIGDKRSTFYILK